MYNTATVRATVPETLIASSTAGSAEQMNPSTGTKSKTPATIASSSAAGTFSTDNTIKVNPVASTDVTMLPITYALIARRASRAVTFTRSRCAGGAYAASHAYVRGPSTSR